MSSSSDFSITSSDGNFAGGLSDPASAQYKHRRNVLDIVNTLQSYGLQRQLDLPQIAVVGSQSVGKSSLIESISGINLPRAKGTCTRCPIECRLSRVQVDWSCHVYLRRTSDIQDAEFGPVIMDKSEVEERIRRAQLAILNPSKPMEDFLGTLLPSSDWNELSFSTDVVSVRIAGRDVDDLSFVDLPGIIQSVRDTGRESDIEEVKSLVETFIKRPSCLILLVVSCETDIENQGARQLARKVDPNGERTMPVLTKPDRIDVGQHDSWIQLVQNHQEKFKHGWHVVKQSNQQQLEAKISWEEARRNERKFFNETSPWSALDESVRLRLGTGYLTQSLGTILFGLIVKRLPGILKEVEGTLMNIKGKLKKLPLKVEGEPVSVVMSRIDGFRQDIKQLVTGNPDDGENGLLQIFRDQADKFGEIIFSRAPCFRPFNSPGPNSDAPSDDTGELHYDDDDDDDEDEDEGLEPAGPRDPSTFIYVDQVLKKIKNARTRELPKNTPYAVKKGYMKDSTKGWDLPAEDLFRRTKGVFFGEIMKLIDTHFCMFTHGGLEGTVLQIVRDHLERCSSITADKINDCAALEHGDPFTSNDRDFVQYKTKFMRLYTAARRNHTRTTSGRDEGTLATIMQQLRDMDVDEEDIARLTRDKADEAIEIIAEVRAYYQLAYKRFIDYIPLIIDCNLLKEFDKTLNVALIRGLKLGQDGSSERCAALLQEDPDLEHEREFLSRNLERFEGARAKLQSLPGVPFMMNTWTAQSEADADYLEE